MLRLIGLVVSIGLADSLNPTTIAPALYLASGERARRDVTEYTLAVFAVYFVGGALVALGPGQLLLAIVPKPDAEDRHVIEVIAGVLMVIAAAALWLKRRGLAERRIPAPEPGSRSSAILGATITAVELPTAFPYFTVIAAIVGSGLDPLRQLVLLVMFNVCFVLPLIGIVATLWFAGEGAERLLSSARDQLQRRWPVVLAGLMLLAGVFIALLGITGFSQHTHGRFGRFSRHLRHLISP
jgi:cytochrome c biogenesis protein CcdA